MLKMKKIGSISLAMVALAIVAFAAPTTAAAAEYGIDGFVGGAYDAHGAGFTKAGGHPDSASTTVTFTPQGPGEFEAQTPVEDTRDVIVDLPPGLTGNPLNAPRCSIAQFQEEKKCPPDTQVGTMTITGGILGRLEFPLYNLVPQRGVVAMFGFSYLNVTVTLRARVRSESDYGITITSVDIPQTVPLKEVTAELWGVPADPSHDVLRSVGTGSGPIPAGAPPMPFVSNPTSCTAPGVGLQTVVNVDSWTHPGKWITASFDHDQNGDLITVDGCDEVAFEPTITARPTTNLADSASGLEFDLHLPQNEDPAGRSTAQLKDAVVNLPPGLTVNPSSANGLDACAPAQIGMTTPVGQFDAHFTDAPDNCPAASRLGDVEVRTPAVDHILPGSVYLASQNQNPFNSLLALYLVVDDPQTGVIAKLPGEVKADPASGQLTAIFRENPQLPVEDLKVDFFGGAGGSLRTPATCGQYSTTSSLTPWSAPYSGPPATPSDSWAIERAPHGACASSAAALPNSPSFEAGTVTPLSGAYSPFVMKLTREDGSQELKGLNLTLPPGLTGKLAGIPYCSDAQIAQAQSRNKPEEGAVEQAHPSCPQSSEVGTVAIGAGAGPSPYYVQGHAYLAGPYKGAPLSLAIVTPAVAGPFDLGTVVVRAALLVNPETAQITVKSDEIPHILEGIPLDVRSIAVKVDRSNFTLNPTNCEAQSITGSAVAVGGSEASLTNRFQVGECGALPFKPKLKLQLKGATGRIGHPALRAVLTAKPGEAGIGRAQVNLPSGEFLDQANLNKTCTKPVLLAGQCPASTVYGHATAWTPLLEKPLEGNVYLVGGYGYKLPALVAELNGQIKILLVGKVDSGKNRGIRNTFELVPDAPVEKFVLEMKGGKKYGLLENSENLCTAIKSKRRANVSFTGQNGKVTQFKPVVANQCGKGKKKTKKDAGHGHKRSRK